MKRFTIAAVFCLAWVSCVLTALGAEITSQDVSGTPEVYVKVVQEPNPLLLGHWGCIHTTTVAKTGDTFKEPIEYWLLKVGDRYAAHFYRLKQGGVKKYKGWREWTLKGDEIVTGTDVSIFVKDGDVYYAWKTDKPTKMTRIAEK
jgi:hypothetical protein